MRDKDLDWHTPVWPWRVSGLKNTEFEIKKPVPDGLSVADWLKHEKLADYFSENSNGNPSMWGNEGPYSRTGPWLYADGSEAPIQRFNTKATADKFANDLMEASPRKSRTEWAMVTKMDDSFAIFLRWIQPCFGSLKPYYKGEYHPTDIMYDFPPGDPVTVVFHLNSRLVDHSSSPVLGPHIAPFIKPKLNTVQVDANINPDLLVYSLRYGDINHRTTLPEGLKLTDPAEITLAKRFYGTLTKQLKMDGGKAVFTGKYIGFTKIYGNTRWVNIRNLLTGQTVIGPRKLSNREGYVRAYADCLWSPMEGAPEEDKLEDYFDTNVDGMNEEQVLERCQVLIDLVRRVRSEA